MPMETVFKLSEQKRNGHSPIYVDQHGNKHDANDEDLYDYIRVQVLGRLADLFLLVGQEEEGELDIVGSTFRLLISDGEKKLERVFDLLDEAVGRLTIHSLSKGYPWHDDNLPLGVFLKPKENPQKVAEGEKADLQKDFPSLSFLLEALSEGQHGIALGAIKSLSAEIRKKWPEGGEAHGER